MQSQNKHHSNTSKFLFDRSYLAIVCIMSIELRGFCIVNAKCIPFSELVCWIESTYQLAISTIVLLKNYFKTRACKFFVRLIANTN
jgi:hypothetical protein